MNVSGGLTNKAPGMEAPGMFCKLNISERRDLAVLLNTLNWILNWIDIYLTYKISQYGLCFFNVLLTSGAYWGVIT